MIEVLRQRLANQHLAAPHLTDPADLVTHLGAVQAQDFPAAKWALALRLPDATNHLLDQTFAEGRFLRTHVLRPTWHFVAPADIRWMLALTAPRIKVAMGAYARVLGLDEAVYHRGEQVIVEALQGGHALTRAEIGAAFGAAGVPVRGGAAIGHILTRAELDALVCSGPPHGTRQTYALLDERVPPTPSRTHDEALAELTWRYFRSHGPALVQDCHWWSGLPIGQVKRGLELNRARLDHELFDGRDYWFDPAATTVPEMPEAAYLLPNYDEYTVAYRERDLYYDRASNWTGDPRADVPFSNVIVLHGRVVGRWARSVGSPPETIELRWAIEPAPREQRAVSAAVERYRAFRQAARPLMAAER